MAPKNKTLRRTYPVNKYPNTRKYIQLVKELESITRRARNLVEQIGDLEFKSRALNAGQPVSPVIEDLFIHDIDDLADSED